MDSLVAGRGAREPTNQPQDGFFARIFAKAKTRTTRTLLPLSLLYLRKLFLNDDDYDGCIMLQCSTRSVSARQSAREGAPGVEVLWYSWTYLKQERGFVVNGIHTLDDIFSETFVNKLIMSCLCSPE